MDGSSPEALSSGESTSSEHISGSRTNRLVSPVPQIRVGYDHLGHGHGHVQNHVSSPPIHPLTSRYVNALSALDYDTSPYNCTLQLQNLPPIKYEQNAHRSGFQRAEVGPTVLKRLDNFDDANQRLPIRDGKSSLSLAQIECVCEAMLQRKDIKRLDEFLKPILPQLQTPSEPVYRARIHVLFHSQHFIEMYKVMESFNYSSRYHSELQNLWYQAHYKEQENIRGRPLGAVDKYRIRNKYNLPRSIWDGEKTTYCFKDRAREALKDCFERCKYPTPSEKKALSEITGLTSVQVSNWFKNKRQRERTPQQREGSELDIGGSFGLQQSCGQGKGGDDSSNDLKPLVTFRSHKKIKMPKAFCAGPGGLNMLDLGFPLPLTRKDSTVSSNSSIYPVLPNVAITSKASHIPVNHNLSEGQGQASISHSGGTGGSSNSISVIQSLSGSQFYSQSAQTHYESLLHHQSSSGHHPYSSHHPSTATSPHILSYG